MKHHFILTSGRSGSNYLANTLNSSKQVVNIGEVLGYWTVPHKLYSRVSNLFNISYEEYLDLLLENQTSFYAAQA